MSRSAGISTFAIPNPSAASRPLTRRRFLVGLGLVAGASAAGPLLSRFRPAGAVRVESSRAGLGTWIRVVARHRDAALAGRAIERAFAAIALVDRQMSVHRADSELSRVNAAAGERAVAVSPALLEVVARARDASLRSARAYDPTLLPLMRLYGFYASGRTHLPTDREIGDTLERMGPGLVALDRGAGTLGLTRRGAALDLGSIGKGWAVDRAVEALRAEGVESGLVDVGRNVYGLGAPSDDAPGWSVGVLHPVTGAVDRVVVLHDSAVATSGNAEQWSTLDGVRVGHLFNARSGRPAAGALSATVHAATGTDADEGSTLAYVLGPGHSDQLPRAFATHYIG